MEKPRTDRMQEMLLFIISREKCAYSKQSLLGKFKLLKLCFNIKQTNKQNTHRLKNYFLNIGRNQKLPARSKISSLKMNLDVWIQSAVAFSIKDSALRGLLEYPLASRSYEHI